MTEENTSTAEATEATKADKATLQRQAYGKAQARLREAHRPEFNEYMAEEAKALGIDWSPKPTEEQKAAQQLHALLAAHPHLREAMQEQEAEASSAPGRRIADIPQA